MVAKARGKRMRQPTNPACFSCKQQAKKTGRGRAISIPAVSCADRAAATTHGGASPRLKEHNRRDAALPLFTMSNSPVPDVPRHHSFARAPRLRHCRRNRREGLASQAHQALTSGRRTSRTALRRDATPAPSAGSSPETPLIERDVQLIHQPRFVVNNYLRSVESIPGASARAPDAGIAFSETSRGGHGTCRLNRSW